MSVIGLGSEPNDAIRKVTLPGIQFTGILKTKEEPIDAIRNLLPRKSDIEPKEEPLKVTILLPRDTVAKLDLMSEKALFGSRGRTIQALVDSVWESQHEISLIFKGIEKLEKLAESLGSQQSIIIYINQVTFILFNLGNVVRRLNQFLGITGKEG